MEAYRSNGSLSLTQQGKHRGAVGARCISVPPFGALARMGSASEEVSTVRYASSVVSTTDVRLRFVDVIYDAETRQVFRKEKVRSLSPRAFRLLEILIENRPKALSKAELHERLWPGTFVSDANLANVVAEVRAALGDHAQKPRIIRTVQRFGYAFQAETKSEAPPPRRGRLSASFRLVLSDREVVLSPGENLLGRDDTATVWIDDTSVSRRHARIVVTDSGATLEDLDSKNGTFLKGRRLRAPAPLSDGDVLKIGPASMTFRVFDAHGSTASAVKR